MYLSDDTVREEYGLGGGAPKYIYRTVTHLGMNSDIIVRFIADSVKKRYSVGMDTVFINWTSMYFETLQNSIIKVE